MTNIFETLREDHDKQRTLLRILANTQGASDGRLELYPKLREELDTHAAAEEQAFYAHLMAESLTQEKARHSVAEHKEIDDLLKEIDATEFDSPAWLPKMKKLREVVEHHLDEEEHEVFQLAGKVLSESAKVSLSSEFESIKAEKQEA